MRKLREYEARGIPAIWVVDPETGSFEYFEEGQLRRGTTFTLPSRAVEFPLAEIAKLVR